jgi:hypothetical protein
MKKERKFSFAKRLIGGMSMLLFLVALVIVTFAGIGIVSSVFFAAAVAGVVGPCVSSGDSLLEIAGDIIELITESIASIVEAIVDFIASLF